MVVLVENYARRDIHFGLVEQKPTFSLLRLLVGWARQTQDDTSLHPFKKGLYT